VLLLPLGCGKGYQLAPISGHVTLDGKPLAGAEVSFYPSGGKDLPYASGKTDEQGNYKLEVFSANSTSDGAVVGENRVEISLHRTDKKVIGRNPELLPARYNSESTTTFTVSPGGSKDANFDLKSK
jgi:hypothetical protein